VIGPRVFEGDSQVAELGFEGPDPAPDLIAGLERGSDGPDPAGTTPSGGGTSG
jgi:hypothetical protein